jgi:predicted Na+-dependent transporter
LNLPSLIVGSFIPDIEVPILIIFFNGIFPDHFILHSLIGAVTLGTIISTLVTVLIYPILTSLFFRLDKVKTKEVCKLTPTLILSCMLGNIFHILLDIPMHPFNPVLWPFIDPYSIVGILVLVFAVEGNIGLGFLIANILNNMIMGLFLLAIVIKSRKNLWEQTLIGKISSVSKI